MLDKATDRSFWQRWPTYFCKQIGDLCCPCIFCRPWGPWCGRKVSVLVILSCVLSVFRSDYIFQYFLISDINHQNRKICWNTWEQLSLMAHKVHPKLRSVESRECPACLAIGIFGLWAGMQYGKNVNANNLFHNCWFCLLFVDYLNTSVS